ncbi:MAG: DUF4032 domain-containing protein [Candidatus Nanopelagicales bacterium]|nr:DUF4032 domain-containing protein [Candidatus Nanopelagicales bacterium]
MSVDELKIRLEAGITGDMLDLPWERPLVDWPAELIVPLPRGISRHVVRFVEVDATIMALKEISEDFANREFRLLRDLEELEVPAVHGVGVVTGRRDPAGEPLPGVLITEHLTWSLPYRSVYARHLRPDTVDRLLDALVLLLARLHLVGFAWNDCSLSNVLFRRDAGAFAAYLVDAETGELHDRLSDGQRINDVEVAHLNIAGGLMDLQAGGRMSEEFDPIAIADEIPRRYTRLWSELTAAEHVDGTQRWRIARRVERLNRLGFDVAELDLRRRPDGVVRLQPKVVDPGYHSRRLMRLVGLDVGENQARRLLNDLDQFTAATRATETPEGSLARPRGSESTAREDVLAAHTWLEEVYEPVVSAVPADLRDKLEDAEVFHEVLEHRWYLSEQSGEDVGLTEAVDDYVRSILAKKPDEAMLLPMTGDDTGMLELDALGLLDPGDD